MKRVAFYTLGCKLNFAETATIARQFRNRGYRVVDWNEPSDIVVINSCAVTSNAERECRQLIRRAHRISPLADIVVVGCYAQVNPMTLENLPGVSLVLGNTEKYSIVDYVEEIQQGPIRVVGSFHSLDAIHLANSIGYHERTRVFIKVQEGCDYHCSYCIVPLARGASRSIPKDDILKQVHEAVHHGYKEVVLTGVNVGDYGKNIGESLLSLLQSLTRVEGIQRIRISSIEPNLLDDELLQFWFSEPKLCKHWHIPLQSGSNTLLRIMKRRYTSDFYRERVNYIKKFVPTAGIGADIIVGFPGETEELFQETYQFLETVPFTYLHVFPYSERPNTPASTFNGKVPAHIRTKRGFLLHELGKQKKKSFLSSFLGKRVTVLFESEVEKGVYSGLTEEYIRVNVRSEQNLKNAIKEVLIEEVADEYCLGSVLEQERMSCK